MEDTPFLVETGFEGKKIKVDMNSTLAIDDSSPDALADQLRENPKYMFYWGSLCEYATKRHKEIENEFKVWYADRYREAKEELLDNGGVTKSKLTESMVQNVVINNNKEEWNKYQKSLNKWSYRMGILSHAAKAYKAKGDSLINLLSYHKKTYEQEEV